MFEKPKRFTEQQLLAMLTSIADKLLVLTLKPNLLHLSLMILVRVRLKASTHETARVGTKWEFMGFGVEARGRRADQNVVTEQSGLSRFAFGMVDSRVGAFQVIFDNFMLKHIQQSTNVEARRVLGNEEWELSL